MWWVKIKDRLKEPTTWTGIALIAAVVGVPAEHINLFNQLVAGLGAILGIALPENNG